MNLSEYLYVDKELYLERYIFLHYVPKNSSLSTLCFDKFIVFSYTTFQKITVNLR